ncbi:MAG: macrolide ABC transporter ATP-binding protein, partial [Lachnospiraceae bacterium]|nr:macrolide ABC transporter ATP-binding protein [Lachnospiraceae bacterium]
LHAEGRTVILITHDNEIAEQADRVIKIRDGRIVSDTRRDPAHSPVQEINQEKIMEDEENE